MSSLRVRRLAQHTARTFGRRIAAAASRELARRGHPAGHESHSVRPEEPAIEGPADDAVLDSLRVELVFELDRLAMRDPDCTGSFRRI
jgi:hypothetical protein